MPPAELPALLAREAARAAGAPVAVYVLDVDGSRLVFLSGDESFPEQLLSPGAIGPELPLEAVDDVRAVVTRAVPGVTMVPIALRDRALGVFLTRGDGERLAALADQAALALELGSGYSDAVHDARRRWRIKPAAEIQQNLLPPRLARLPGATLAGGVLPGYDVGGDFLDHAHNADGVWLAVGDGLGKGDAAASLASLAIGALRAARRSGAEPAVAMREMHEVLWGLGSGSQFATAIVARWTPASRELEWINAGHPRPLLFTGGRAQELEGETTFPLGIVRRERDFRVARRVLTAGDRLLLYSDGVYERRIRGGVPFGLEGIERAVRPVVEHSAARLVRAVQDAVRAHSDGPLRDDATLLALAVDP